MTDATEARNEALEAFNAAADLDNIAEVASAEQEAANDFLETLAGAVVDGLSAAQAKQHCDVVADAAQHYNKTTLVDLLEEKIEEMNTGESGRRPFDKVLLENLQEVVIVRTTDAKQSTHYRWQFKGGTIETSSTAEGRSHFSWMSFRDDYFAAVGEDPSKPTKNRRGGEEWREFIVGLVDSRGREVQTRGPRSVAVDSLQNFIRRTDAFGELKDVVDRDAVHLDGDPEEGDAEELWVPNHHIKRICDDVELGSTRALQIELDSRGYTVDGLNGVSYSTFVNNSKMTFWVLDAGIAQPAGYIEEPVDPAEQVRIEEEEDSDEESGNEPGMIGSVGGGE